jgi:hypothetical protein
MACAKLTENALDAWLMDVLEAAKNHGENSDDPEHEIGDVVGLVWSLWRAMTPAQRRQFQTTEEFNQLIADW